MLPSILTVAIAVAAGVSAGSVVPQSGSCKCVPTDACWPSHSEWDAFNKTVGGSLIRNVPLGSPCHDPNYDAVECQRLRDNWVQSSLHDESSTSMMTPYWANQSCDPFTDRARPCILGTYTQYAVNISTVAQIKKTIAYAKKKNIRLVIRNTGHCFMGKSTGYGSVSIWTHHLKGMNFFNYQSESYSGTAVKVMAGVQTGEIYAEAKKRGLMIVGGECPSVGFAGGYIQGGGHSPLSSIYGLAADNTLSFEVITAGGDLITASREQNSDLFWALSGGGGGTFGVVWSATVKAYKDVAVAGAICSFSTTDTLSYYSALNFYHTQTPAWTDKGAFAYAFYQKGYFQMWPLFYPGGKGAQVEAMIAPLKKRWSELGLAYTCEVTTYTNFSDAFYALFVPVTVGGFQFGGRLIPRSIVNNANKLISFVDIAKSIVEDGTAAIDVAIKAGSSNADNAVNPAWRNAEFMFLPATTWSNDPADWERMLADREKITHVYDAALKQITPGGGAYMNEGDGDEPDWKQAFFGSKYDKLLKIKKKWDSAGIFYARNAVGSDAWEVLQDGRLCKAH
ncbi:FAD binding domain-containing protein [Tirmania nivea]|nr:FAD binding domain-containing protein [Tirmania nivea]